MRKPKTVDQNDLYTMARAAHEEVEFEGDFAYATVNGHPYKARVVVVPCRTCNSLHGPHEPCVQLVQDCAEGVTP